MKTQELKEMNELMKSLEQDILEMQQWNEKLKIIAQKKEQLDRFYEEKWMNYYDEAEQYNDENLEILNQDSLWNALSDTDIEARDLVKNVVNLL
ncbi:MAG: DUF4298 domain-containing protein [Cruoricaptor ignavus]|nr:DUF4298 domain-containing protein [Cruoricaptor ignavus]